MSLIKVVKYFKNVEIKASDKYDFVLAFTSGVGLPSTAFLITVVTEAFGFIGKNCNICYSVILIVRKEKEG